MNFSNENIIHVKDEGIEYIQFKRLLEYEDKLKHAFTVGIDNDYRMPLYNSPNNILTNEQIEQNKNSYKKLCKSIGIEYNDIVKTNQVHGDVVKIVKEKVNNNRPDFHEKFYEKTDGLITSKMNIAICTTNADCIVLMMYDPVKEVIANVHSGWKGTVQKIAKKTIEKMEQEYGCKSKDIICCISPSIRNCHFEVDTDVKDLFKESIENAEVAIKKSNQKWHIDTIKINTEMLKESGLREENIIDSKICTVCNSKYIHSYRGSKHTNGLEIGIIELKTDDRNHKRKIEIDEFGNPIKEKGI